MRRVLAAFALASMVPGLTASSGNAETIAERAVTCFACHGEKGQGSPLGPDITGKKWLWSDGSLAGLAAIIEKGVAQPKNYRVAMPPYGGSALARKDLDALAAYAWALSHASR